MTARLTIDQIREVRRRLELGETRNQIASTMNLKWKRVDYWMRMNEARITQLEEVMDLKSIQCRFESDCGYHYSYLLGCYLGDGYLNPQGKYTWKIRITTDEKYPELIQYQRNALQNVCGNSHVVKHTNAGCVDVFAYNKNLPCWFPQHGKGRKHTRPIVLEKWQQEIVDNYPWEFIRGLYHTDGSRYIQKQNERQYLRYNLTNSSKDIIDLFASTCDKVNIRYVISSRLNQYAGLIVKTAATQPTTKWTLTINRAEDVKEMDRRLGPKTIPTPLC